LCLDIFKNKDISFQALSS